MCAATLLYWTLADARWLFKPSTLIAKRDGKAFSLTIDSLSTRKSPTMEAAHQEGYRMAVERAAVLLAHASASADLPPDHRRFTNRSFVSLRNSCGVIRALFRAFE